MSILSELRHVAAVLIGRIPLQHPLLCTHCPAFQPVLKRHEYPIYKAHRKLLCPCGGTLRKAADTDLSHITRAAAYYTEAGQEP